MSVEAIALVLHHSRARGTAKLVLIGIANHDGDGGAWPSIATLSKYAGCSDRAVQRALRELIGLREVAVHRQAGGPREMRDTARPNRYDVLVQCPPTCDRTRHHKVTEPSPQPVQTLWTDGVTPASPGDTSVTGGVTPASPGGVTPASPEPSIEHDPEAAVVERVTTERARPCPTCGASGAEECATASGRDHPRRRGLTPATPAPVDLIAQIRADLSRDLDATYGDRLNRGDARGGDDADR